MILRTTLPALVATLGCASAPPAPSAAEAIARIETRFGIDVVSSEIPALLASFRTGVRANSPGPPALRSYVAWLEPELAKYPPQAFQCAHVRTLVLAVDLRRPGARSRGSRWLGRRGDASNAVAAVDDDALILDAESAEHGLEYRRSVLHHEFFHLLDAEDDGGVSEGEWAAVNRDGFKYGTGGANTSRFVDYDVTTEGFVSAYSKTAVAEDKAEVFSLLLSQPEVLRARTRTDEILAAKVRLLREQLSAMCPAFELPEP